MIAIIGAQKEELKAIKELLVDLKEVEINGYLCFLGKIKDKNVIVAKGGIGGVNTAILLTLLFSKYTITFAYNLGTCGSYKEASVNVGDVIIGDKLSFYDTDVTVFSHYRYGQMAGQPPFYESDYEKIKYLEEQDFNFKIIKGGILSGEKFLTKEHNIINTIHTRFSDLNIKGFEMESAYFGQVCHTFNIPFLVLRVVSDLIDSESQKTDYEKLLENSSKYYSKIIYQLI